MNSLLFSIQKIYKGAARSFSRFPAAIGSALVISIVGIIRIGLQWEVQKKYNLLFDSIQLAFLLGAAFSMAAVALDEISSNKKKSSFLLANLSGILIALITFLLLYFFGGRVQDDKIVYLSNIATARAMVGVFISVVGFIYIISKAKYIDSFSDAFFITHRAFLVSAIYGIVIMAGVSGVVGAFKALVYREMSSDVFQYLGVLVGFFTYTMFLGYFPSFRATENPEEVQRVEEQPRFIFVLFGYILIPIIMALTVVLLLWSVRVILNGMDVSFTRLSGITTSYVIIGIWLHIMVSKYKIKIAEFYKRAYPFAGILILIFEAWALFNQINKYGLKTEEYSFLMIWVFALISVILIILLKDRAYRKIAITAIVISIIWVLPIIGYQDLTFNSQVNRLEENLINENLLVDNNIKTAEKEIEYTKRVAITEAVDYISYSQKESRPIWFKKNLEQSTVFKNTFGFEKAYPIYEYTDEFESTNYRLESEVIDISEYDGVWNILVNEEADNSVVFEGRSGSYEIIWETEAWGYPKITVKLDDVIIIDQPLDKYLNDLSNKYPRVENLITEVPIEDMSLTLEGEGISIRLVFGYIDAYYDINQDRRDYYVNIQGIYIKYK